MSKPSYPRARRVNAIVHEVVAEEIERLTDPRLAMVTVTAVSVAPDMRRATVFFSSFDLSQLAEAQAGLRAAAPRLRLAIGREVRIKFTPVLEFVPDQGVLQGEKIEALLRELTSDKDEPTDE
ncbi:MAG TPA: 30S ribosome-binding factor RbfA [Acidimicrobiia bacterium]|jgi:ribosome-binding factor A|nr:30S ribosome-binding factor RbfA [Acidimicrobiia bacterium]